MTEEQPHWITYLEWLDEYERNHEPGVLPHLSELMGRELDGRENQLWRETLNKLHADGLIIAHNGMSASSTSAQFTAEGRKALDRIRARQADPVIRKSAAANGLLRWLYELDPYGSDWQLIDNIIGTSYAVLDGLGLSTHLFRQAAERLKQMGLVKASDYVIELGTPLLARLTDAGQELVESGLTLEEFMAEQRRPQGGNVAHFYGDMNNSNVAWASSHVSQTVQTTSSGLAADEIATLVRAIVEALPALNLSDDARREVSASAAALEVELERPAPDQQIARTYMQRIKDAIVTEAGSQLGLLLAAHIKMTMAAIGSPIE